MSAPTLTRDEAAPTASGGRRVSSARRVRMLAAGIALVSLVFAGRLVQIQAVQAEQYSQRADALRTTTVTLPATRGEITDRNGVPLAVTVAARNVTADQTLVKDPAATAAVLAPLLGLDDAWLSDQLTGNRRYVTLAAAVTPAVWDRIESQKLAGIFSEPTTSRVYPAGPLAGNVVGFVGADGSGLAGIESAYQAEMAGTAGSLTYERGADGRRIPTAEAREVPERPGASVRLTLDRDIQWTAQRAIAAKVAEVGAASGTVVVMDTRTGQILAMATAPTVDPSQPSSAAADDRGNRAVSDIYEPGSTSKVMTMAAVIEEGKMTPDTPLTVPDNIRRGGSTFHDHDPHPVEHLTLAGVLAKSSNVGTIMASESIGGQKLYEYLQRFGLGRPTGLDFPGESSGLLPAYSTWSATTFPTVAFGQGLSVNSVQLASVYATLANGGVRIDPSLVAGTVSPAGEFTPAAPAHSERVVSAATAATVRTMLEGVVSDEGTAPQAAIPGYRVAGKTGTAQRADDTCQCYRGYTASFVGLAPADDPRLVVAVVLQEPQRGHFGGMLAGPVFKDVMSFALKSLQIPPSGSAPPTVRVYSG